MGKADADGPGLPDLPPEWGRVVVPDDASALAEEAEQVRRELRRQARNRPHPWLAPRRVPLIVLLIAVVTTVAGLLTATWPRANRSPGAVVDSPEPAPTHLADRTLPALDLVDSGQSPIPLRGLLPAVVLLVDGCSCLDLVTETVLAAPDGVTVVTVAATRPGTVPAGTQVRALADPAAGLRAFLHLPAQPDSVSVLLADRAGQIVLVVPEATTVSDYRAELSRLVG